MKICLDVYLSVFFWNFVEGQTWKEKFNRDLEILSQILNVCNNTLHYEQKLY